ncbi:hypothetical protein SAMN02799630_01239 [Paenibacillus sp. UNCCL117]|uniref:hypothetical protein n=1 Tax=unclassified Paenibacillus TaxID=185978 RepID=UPI00087E8522|nr:MULTISPECIES: hypothetical protein [unclassified Paenibacillus]SDC70599.1 hypothetical protein SAMN04488602_103217 [Paenibacillus sp. cl123]SFW24244.1 hypothetical protein SAMN02799630_01239 [Paenibacillus sp. UNCCL117]
MTRWMREAADQLGGYRTGTLVVENGVVSLQDAAGSLTELMDVDRIEVVNEDVYKPVTLEEALTLRTVDGWPLLAGLYSRVKIWK